MIVNLDFPMESSTIIFQYTRFLNLKQSKDRAKVCYSAFDNALILVIARMSIDFIKTKRKGFRLRVEPMTISSI